MKKILNIVSVVYLIAIIVLLTGYAINAFNDGTWEPLAAWVSFWAFVFMFFATMDE